VRGWHIRTREKNAGVVSPPNSIQQAAGNIRQHKKTVVWLGEDQPYEPELPFPSISLTPFVVPAPHTYLFLIRPVPVVPTMTTTLVRGEKACSTRCFPLVVRITIPL